MIIKIVCRNNADARRMGNGAVRVPGAGSVRHTGAKNVVIETSAVDTVKVWLDNSFLVASYEVENDT